MKHWQYLRYLARHKWFVLRAGLILRVPFWRLLIHDWSKFLPSEWFPYADHFYGSRCGLDRVAKTLFKHAWLKHIHRNPHHWQHWVLRSDDGSTETLTIPEPLVREMVADWAGAGRAINGGWDLEPWWLANRVKVALAPETAARVVELIQGWTLGEFATERWKADTP